LIFKIIEIDIAVLKWEQEVGTKCPWQRSLAGTDIPAGGQQAVSEWTVAQGFSLRSNFERRRSGGISCPWNVQSR
jgi:hypothetical protein